MTLSQGPSASPAPNLVWIEPQTWRVVAREATDAAQVRLGTLCVVRVHHRSTGRDLATLVRKLRCLHSGSPIVVQTGIWASSHDTLEIARCVEHYGCSGALLAGQDLENLIPQLTDASALLPRIARWLFLTGRTSLDEAAFVESAFASWETRTTVKGAVRGVAPPRTVRDRFRRAGLPTPYEWLNALHLLQGLLRLQAAYRGSRPTPYVGPGQSAADRPLEENRSELIGLSADDAVRVLGWEPLMASWLGSPGGRRAGGNARGAA